MNAAAAHAAGTTLGGRYRIFFQGRECGEERWEVVPRPDGYVVTGEQVLVAPHPFASRQEYRALLTETWRITALEILWSVGERTLHAIHAADGGTWRVRIEHQGHVREQHGDFPEFCEVDYGTHLFNAFVLARRDFGLNGEHEFPALRIGPPMMAVTPTRLLYRCVEIGSFETPFGAVAAKRYQVSMPDHPEEEGYGFWADEEGFVLESYEGHEPSRSWMKLVELERKG